MLNTLRCMLKLTIHLNLLFFNCFIGTRFRPLSLNIPKPLFPLAGQPMVHHPISACKRVYMLYVLTNHKLVIVNLIHDNKV